LDPIVQQQRRLSYLSKADLVALTVRDMIRSGELPPGSVLRQRDVAQRLGVSPTPVREALQRLEAEGFVVSEAHRGAMVVRSEDWRLYENALIRAALESLAAQLAAEKATLADLAEMERINEELAAVTDPDLAVQLNRRFHFRIYEASGSTVMLAQLNLLWRTLDGGPRVERPISESVAQHREILQALRLGDGAAVAERTRRHILEAFPRPPEARQPSQEGHVPSGV
jgi:DNA-binding GntR family transcriptional regulator